MKLIIISLYILMPFVLAQTNVTSCKGKPSPDAVYLDDCVNPPCNLVRGTNGTTIIIFTPQTPAETFRPTVKGTYLGISQSHDLGDQGVNGCNYLLHGECPLKAGTQVTHRIIDEVSKNEMKVKGVRLTYNLLDQNAEVLACFEVKVNIVD